MGVDTFSVCQFTATPAPNDHMELGQHSAFLGAMASNEMLDQAGRFLRLPLDLRRSCSGRRSMRAPPAPPPGGAVCALFPLGAARVPPPERIHGVAMARLQRLVPESARRACPRSPPWRMSRCASQGR